MIAIRRTSIFMLALALATALSLAPAASAGGGAAEETDTDAPLTQSHTVCEIVVDAWYDAWNAIGIPMIPPDAPYCE